MTPEIERIVDRVRQAYGYGCFACGPDNPIGLHLEFLNRDDEGNIHGRFDGRSDFRGAADSLHGGIAATALDELLVWAGIILEGVMSVTGTLDLRYRRPLTVGHTITGSAWLTERTGRRLRVAGHLLANGRPAVEATGLYLVTADVSEL